jgi:hypothetical protein
MIFSPQSGFWVIRQIVVVSYFRRIENILAYFGLLRGRTKARATNTSKKIFLEVLVNFSMMARILGDQLSSIGPHDIRLLRNTIAKIR